MAVTWPLHMTFIVSAPVLLHVFGADYAVGAPVMLVLATCMLVATGIGMADTVLLMSGRTAWSLANAVVSLAVQIGLDLWLIPQHGVLGAAIGWGAAILLRNGAAIVQVVIYEGVHSLSRPTLVVALANLVCFAALPLVVEGLLGESWLSLGVGLALGGSGYLVALWWFRDLLRLRALRALRRPGGGA